jgi:hypothetical protein
LSSSDSTTLPTASRLGNGSTHCAAGWRRWLAVGVDAGRNGSPWHLALSSTHDDWDALATYANAPAHLEVLAWLDGRIADRAAVDYET